ncbi:hypothetical protein FRB91_010373 [Serendipita sp. 411]|nr:hypothetical protein FRC18_003510 [Serendipita sp. 400]KAG8848926.1 hypothetical protein FRB91_010373 [Serendipita sp. 411]
MTLDITPTISAISKGERERKVEIGPASPLSLKVFVPSGMVTVVWVTMSLSLNSELVPDNHTHGSTAAILLHYRQGRRKNMY